MKLQVHSIHFDADSKLVEFIQKKVDVDFHPVSLKKKKKKKNNGKMI